MKKFLSVVFACALCTLSLAGCGTVELELDQTMLSDYDYSRLKDQNITLNVANWGEYMCIDDPEMINVNEQFEALTGIKVNYTTYETNETLFAKMSSGGADYDVIIPSDYMISQLIRKDMLEKLDYSNIPNFETHIMDNFKNPPYDPANEYSVPYNWGMVCLVYNKTMYSEAPTSWSALWDDNQKGNILMFNNPRDAFGIAESYLGYSLNTENPDEITESFNVLKNQFDGGYVQAYVMDEVFDKMESGSAAIAPYYVGDAANMAQNNTDLEYFIPVEGTNQFIDAACIPKGAKHKEAAEMYINYLCETEIALANGEYIGYSTPNKYAYELLDEDVKNDERRYPSTEFLANNTESFNALSDEANDLMQSLWNKIRFSN